MIDYEISMPEIEDFTIESEGETERIYFELVSRDICPCSLEHEDE